MSRELRSQVCSECDDPNEHVNCLGYYQYCTEVFAPQAHRQAPLFDTELRRLFSRLIERDVGEAHRIAIERPSLEAAKDLARAFRDASDEIFEWIEAREEKLRALWPS